MKTMQKELLDNIKLPSPPTIALRLLETINSEDFSISDVAQIIRSDPALAAKVLKLVNSSYYALPVKIINIERALTMMGVHVVKNIALSFTLMDGFDCGTGDGFDLNYFWKRAITAAIGAEVFSKHLGIRDENIFITALLQDFCILVVYRGYPDRYVKLLAEKNSSRIPLEILERREFGFSHQELGSEILRQWGMPEDVYMPILYHHCYADAPEQYLTKSRILYLAYAISAIFSDHQSIDKIEHFVNILKEDLGISNELLEALVDEMAEKIIEICSCFEIPPGEMKPLSKLLQEANEGLCDLNLSYEKLLEEFKKEKSRVEKLASELKDTNDKLNEANHLLTESSIRDHLTGLYNRRYLFDVLTREVATVQRYGESLSALLLDIDHFKQINDTYGHNGGDRVLNCVSRIMLESIRGTDIAVRYGGEEFIILMPQTDLIGGKTVAERIRKAIEAFSVSIDGRAVKVTISIGVASCGAGSAAKSPDELVNSADQALYRAKKEGRNRVVTTDDVPA
jgi:diguanylate cyclase (GGDEF)-like protein